MLKRFFLRTLARHPLLEGTLLTLMGRAQPIFLDYPVAPRPRFGYDQPSHPELHAIIDSRREIYRRHLEGFLRYREEFLQIPLLTDPAHLEEPAWCNGWLFGLDAAAIYGLLAEGNPKRYFEIGSGNSTKFARRAIRDRKLRTTITSFDPHPRAEVDRICDKVIRQPVENVDPSVFQELECGDILYIDNSHRAFMNSDVTVVFLEILPRLKPGVIVEFHDIFLPWDYPPDWDRRYYSEQYLLATWFLGGGQRSEILLPNMFISSDDDLKKVLAPIWNEEKLKTVGNYGGSFWMKMI